MMMMSAPNLYKGAGIPTKSTLLCKAASRLGHSVCTQVYWQQWQNIAFNA
jgi:hypothetical protein